MLNILLLFACFEFKNDFAVDNDNDGLTEYDGDCDDNDANVGLAECTDDDGDGFAEVDGDCDDAEALTFPGAAETDSETDCMRDLDEDGYGDSAVEGAVVGGSDCNDDDAEISPAVDEVCDEVDNNCDGTVDEDTATDVFTWYRDTDGDGFGDEEASTNACTQPQDYVDNADDCDDLEAAVNPDADEVCDGIDNNCDDLIDDADPTALVSTMTTWYADVDADGYGDLAVTLERCDKPDGHVDNYLDCNDFEPSINPDATEVCDGVDNNCDNQIDDADNDLDPASTTVFYQDGDNDGYGSTVTQNACLQPGGYVLLSGDCDDGLADVNPAATEICDLVGYDEDCSGLANDDDPFVDPVSQSTFYLDADGDGFGDANSTMLACAEPAGHVATDTDCNDADAAVNPVANEVCDGIDNDCDNQIDDADASLDPSSRTTFYRDVDGDGYGDPFTTESQCEMPSNYVTNSDDCNDTEALAWTGATEVCDGVDNDCDGPCNEFSSFDCGELDATDGEPYHVDNDFDQHSPINVPPVYLCGDAWASSYVEISYFQHVQPILRLLPESSVLGDDCDDSDGSVFVGSAEQEPTLCTMDADEDGYGPMQPNNPNAEPGSDCDDQNGNVHPDVDEFCDGIDNNCVDGENDAVDPSHWLYDGDGDGHPSGDTSLVVVQCDDPGGYVELDSAGDLWDVAYDCDDTEPSILSLDYELDAESYQIGYIDSDFDGFGSSDPMGLVIWCENFSSPVNSVFNNTDCDDSDPGLGSNEVDRDCDGVMVPYDCDNDDAGLLSFLDDQDCDGALTADDCDDANPFVGAFANDLDCDGVPTEDDCDDSDPTTVDDMDCDGYWSWEDCDDNHAYDPAYQGGENHYTVVAVDQDCDGWLTADDCDDLDPYTHPYNSNYESDPALSTACVTDVDNDGYLPLSQGGTDCDDYDSFKTPEDNDGDGYSTCDGDCDDDDTNSTFEWDDGDCDGALTGDDCDDTSVELGDIAIDFDCDGVDVYWDCDDTNPLLGDLGLDFDCDGVLSEDDCVDTDETALMECRSVNEADWSVTGFVTGNSGSDRGFYHMLSAGDVNGDGYDDILLSDSWFSGTVRDGGMVALFLGDAQPAQENLTSMDADYLLVGDQVNGNLGRSVAAVGDVDGNGYDDFMVVGNGLVYLFYGEALSGTQALELADADVVFSGGQPSVVTAVGDVDGGGRPDFLISDLSDTSGTMHLFFGEDLLNSSSLSMSDAAVTITGTVDESYPYGFDGGDVDGDGLSDILVCALWYFDEGNGQCFIFFGPSLSGTQALDLEDADRLIFPTTSEDFDWFGQYAQETLLGFSWAGASISSDIDGDGLNDLIVSSLDDQYLGWPLVFLGSTLSDPLISTEVYANWYDYAFTGFEYDWYEDTIGEVLHNVHSVGDLDGDGFDDFGFTNQPPFISERRRNEVVSYVFHTSTIGSPGTYDTSASNLRYRHDREGGESCYYGHQLSSAGDFNGDGHDDLLIGDFCYRVETCDDVTHECDSDQATDDFGKVSIVFGGQ